MIGAGVTCSSTIKEVILWIYVGILNMMVFCQESMD